MEIFTTENIIIFLTGGGAGASFNLVWKVITGKLELRRMKIEVESKELEHLEKMVRLIDFMEERNRNRREFLAVADEMDKDVLIEKLKKDNEKGALQIEKFRNEALKSQAKADAANNR